MKVGIRLNSSKPSSGGTCGTLQNAVSSLYLTLTDKDEVLKVIKSLQPTNSLGRNGISTKILKANGELLVRPLSFLANVSLEAGVFLQDLNTKFLDNTDVCTFSSWLQDSTDPPLSPASRVGTYRRSHLDQLMYRLLPTAIQLNNYDYGTERCQMAEKILLPTTGGEFHVSEIGTTGVRLPPPRSVAPFLIGFSLSRAFDLESVQLLCERYSLLYRTIRLLFNERHLQLLHNVEGDDSDNEPVDDSDEDPNYVVSDNELNQSENDDSFAVDEPQLEDEDDIHYSVENYLVQESEDDFFGGKYGSVWCRKEPPKQRRTPQHP
ncbi:hypothetical protein J6590_037187 [Homalodisca vitripennis]|nr:hypothetical protein J6590_037187 [Homalodisca vitripennis]